MKYALTKNPQIAVKPGKAVKNFTHLECKGEMQKMDNGQFLCLECFKTGYLVKKV